MAGLNHRFIYCEKENNNDGIEVLEDDYVDIHDDFINYFSDFLNWVEMYNLSKKEKMNGLCHYGITIIKDDNIKKLANIINSMINLFENSPENITLTGMYTCTEGHTNGYYKKINIEKENFMKKIIKFRNIVEKAMKNERCIEHHGI